MTAQNPSIEQRLSQAYLSLTNASEDPTVRAALAAYGYTSERLQEGRERYQKALVLYEQKTGAYGNLTSTRTAVDVTKQSVQADYTRYSAIARVAFRADETSLYQIGLLNPRKQSYAGWLAQTRQFYVGARASDTILSRFATFGVTAEMLDEGLRKVAALEAQVAERQQCRGEALDATKARNEAIKDLNAWMRDFRAIARLAFKDRPQQLEKLGLKTITTKAASEKFAKQSA